MRTITRGIVTAGSMIGAVFAGAGTGVAEPAVPSGTFRERPPRRRVS
ncbi:MULTISPECIES: hypothetical protein [Rhodococcus]|nr:MULTISPECIES: hypothetical protein [Rhodococcus]